MKRRWRCSGSSRGRANQRLKLPRAGQPVGEVGSARERDPKCAVIPSQMVHDCLRRAFAPTQRGIVGLTEQLLAACVGGGVEFERVEDRCVCRWNVVRSKFRQSA
jgi:hypothetical protein